MRTQLRRRSIPAFSYTPLAAALAAALVPQAQATVVTVTNSVDNGFSYFQDPTNGTNLRGAIDHFNSVDVNGAPFCTGSDTINFFHNGSVPFVISVSGEMDTSCGGLTIDGGGSKTNSFTLLQAMYGGMTGYAIWSGATNNITVKGLDISGWSSGTALGGHLNADNNIIHANGTGIFISYGGVTSITNNTIYSNNGDGVDVFGTTTSFSGNVIGLDTNGNWAGNSGSGIFSVTSALTVDSNVISANSNDGIELEDDSGSTITNNKIGTDASGTSQFGNNTGIGVFNSSGASISGNVISANYGGGIFLSNSSGITIDGNAIGTDPTRNQDVSNGNGIDASCGSDIKITNNAIASYNDHGIFFSGITGGGSMDIVNNAINVAGDGVTSLGGSSYGVMLENNICASSLQVPGKRKSGSKAATKGLKSAIAGATTNVMISGNNISNASSDGIFIGGGVNNTITGNTIQNNGGYGVNIITGTGNQIVDNSKIFNNATQAAFPKGINLDFPGGVYQIGPDSAHANNGMNAPTITDAAVDYSRSQTTVKFTLSAIPGSYEVQVCDNPPGTSAPGCNNLQATTTVTVPTAGSASGEAVFFGISSDNFSATATSNATNDTSEFSSVFTIKPAPNVTYVPGTTLDFGNVAVNGSSPPMTVTLKSSGTTPYTISNIGSSGCYGGSICYGGAFTCTTTCVPGNAYNPGGGCNITATFNPTALTSYSQTIGICDDSPSYGGTITLTGVGVTPPPVAFQPASFDFGQVSVGTPSAPETFTVVNGGTATVLLGEPTVDDANFVILSNACGSSIAAGATCPVVAEFLPQAGGTVHGTLSMPAGSGGPPPVLLIKRHGAKAAVAGPGLSATASLTGTGVAQGAILLPSTMDLGTYSVGSPPNQRDLTLVNTGNAPVNVNTVAVSGPFQVTNGCTSALAPQTSCVITVLYSSPVLGPNTGTLTVSTDAPNGSGAIALTGNTVPSPVPILTLSPAQIGYGDRLLGSTSSPQRITITNVGNAQASVGLAISNTDFVISFTSCGATLAPAASCYADVSLRPVGFGPRTGTFLVNSNATNSPQGVTLSGSGCRPYSAGASRLGSSFGCSP